MEDDILRDWEKVLTRDDALVAKVLTVNSCDRLLGIDSILAVRVFKVNGC